MSETDRLARWFCCPVCHGELTAGFDYLGCGACRTRWEIIDGIPCFVTPDTLEEPTMAAHMDRWYRIAVECGWQAAAEECARTQTGRRSEHMFDYICNEARADFRFILPLRPESVILDIGSGWGTISVAFARGCSKVYALDSSLANLKFVNVRARQEGLCNLIPVKADATMLPLPPRSCDAVIMVGVLEWVAWGRTGGDPTAVFVEHL